MAVFNGAFPILPGKVEAARELARETMGARRAGFEESQKRQGVTRETWSVQELPDGTAMSLVWFESPDPAQALVEAARDSSEYAVWFRERVKEINGIDVDPDQILAGAPELLLDWRG